MLVENSNFNRASSIEIMKTAKNNQTHIASKLFQSFFQSIKISTAPLYCITGQALHHIL